MKIPDDEGLYGLVAEFDGPDPLVEATRRATGEGYRRVDAYAPYPIEELADALHFRNTGISYIVLIGGIIGGIAGFALQYWVSVYAYPINSGGKPLDSWPAFVPVTFETTILGAALAAVIGMLALNGLPLPYHPLFNVPRFPHVTRDGFFLCIEASDPLFDTDKTRAFLQSLEPREVLDVPN